MPVAGFAMLVAVIVNANIAAQWTGGIWIAAGILVLVGLHLAKRSPELAGTEPSRGAGMTTHTVPPRAGPARLHLRWPGPGPAPVARVMC